MNELFKFHATREFQEPHPEVVDAFGIHSHPAGQTSQWFRNLIELCQTNDYQALAGMAVEYLKSDKAIYSLDQLDSDAKEVIRWLDRKGNEFELEALFAQVDLRRFKDYFSEKKDLNSALVDFQRVADTWVSLGIIREMGNPNNLDYQQILRGLHLIRTLYHSKKEIEFGLARDIMKRPILVPACLFVINSCSKKIERFSPFSHLDFGKFDPKLSPKQDPAILADETQTGEHQDLPHEDCGCDKTGAGDGDCPCTCSCDEQCKDQNPCCAVLRPVITDLMVVKEELSCYEAVDIAYIENIMLGGRRERNHRHLERTESLSETETSSRRYDEKDLLVSERYGLKTETNNTVQEDASREAGVKIKAFGTGYQVSSSFNASSKTSKSAAHRMAREYARDVVERSVSKVEESMRKRTSLKRIIETEETNIHSFENLKTDPLTDKHLVGQYHYVSKISKAHVLNYGKRMMFDFVLPEPMKLYQFLLDKQLKQGTIEKPEAPELTPSQISDQPSNPVSGTINYMDLAHQYKIAELDSPPKEVQFFSTTLTMDQDREDPHSTAISTQSSTKIEIPNGYTSQQSVVKGAIVYAHFAKDDNGNAHHQEIQLAVGTSLFALSGRQSTADTTRSINLSQNMPDVSGEVQVVLSGYGIIAAGLSVDIKCVRTKEAFEAWQLKIYGKILAAYEAQLQRYEAEVHAAKQQAQAKHSSNYFVNRQIEETELKRMAISYLSCQFYDRFTALKRNVKPCGYPQMDLEQAEKDGLFIQFFEQVFDWKQMTYVFYKYFWGDKKCSWLENIQTQTGDALFDQARTSGAARLQVPVTLGMEPLAIHWVAFGEIWMGQGQPPLPGDPYYISMAQETLAQHGHYYVDRQGTVAVSHGANTVTLNNSDEYWDFVGGSVDQNKIDNDINREIIIDCVVYRIVSIQEVPTPNHDQWIIELDRNYEGPTHPALKFQTGALVIGSPIEVRVPTELVYLRNDAQSDCLPCYPLPKCS